MPNDPVLNYITAMSQCVQIISIFTLTKLMTMMLLLLYTLLLFYSILQFVDVLTAAKSLDFCERNNFH